MAISEWDQEKPQDMRRMFTEFFDETNFPIHENFASYWNANKNSNEEMAEKEFNIPSVYAEVETIKRDSKSLS